MNTHLLLVPAKINHSLRIGAVQTNGLHTIESVMQKISLFDRIEIKILPTSIGKIEIILAEDSVFRISTDSSNLIFRAVRLFFGSDLHPDVRIILTKKIPIGAGLGGGSSDAASMLLFLAEQFPDYKKTVLEMATELGSDVPFFLGEAPSALVSGTGETLATHPAELGEILIVKPHQCAIETAWAYRAFDEMQDQKSESSVNDFEPVIFAHFPELEKIKHTLLDCGAKHAHLSGSGATVFGIFEEKKDAFLAQQHFDDAQYWSFVGRLLD